MVKDIPTVSASLKTHKAVVGNIFIESDGTFRGRITDPDIHSLLVTMAKHGLADGYMIVPAVVPAKKETS